MFCDSINAAAFFFCADPVSNPVEQLCNQIQAGLLLSLLLFSVSFPSLLLFPPNLPPLFFLSSVASCCLSTKFSPHFLPSPVFSFSFPSPSTPSFSPPFPHCFVSSCMTPLSFPLIFSLSSFPPQIFSYHCFCPSLFLPSPPPFPLLFISLMQQLGNIWQLVDWSL